LRGDKEVARRWSIGDMAVGVTWMVFTHRGRQRVVAKAGRQAEAWAEAVRLAHVDEFRRNGAVEQARR
jgi:hypothetical protein